MELSHLLHDIALVFGLATVVQLVFSRLKIPSILGFLLTGVLVGPHGFRLVENIREIEHFAEIGVILLLFTIGLEFSTGSLLRMKKTILLGGGIQVGGCIAAVMLLKHFATGDPWPTSIFMGFLIALSSTAIVLKLLQETAQIETPHGRAALGVLIFQDLIVVPMMLVTPLLAGAGGSLSEELFALGGKTIALLAGVYVLSRWVAPWALYQVARMRNQEIFLMFIGLFGLGIAWLSAEAGLSLALGAFLAGLIISESEFSRQALSSVSPFRDIFTSFFFVSIGMLLDAGFVLDNLGVVVALAVACLVGKTLLGMIGTLALSMPVRTAVMSGLALSQVGEFSFILASVGLQHDLISPSLYQYFLAVSVLTMAASPFCLAMGPRIANLAVRLPLPGGRFEKKDIALREDGESEKMSDHLIIIGHGPAGEHLAAVARSCGIAYAIIETNPETVRRLRQEGEPVHYGDAAQEAVLEHVQVDKARMLVVAISDPVATRHITQVVRHLQPSLHILVRTRFVSEVAQLQALGADEVVPEEFETSIEIFSRALRRFLVPREEIEELVTSVRKGNYEVLRSPALRGTGFGDLRFHVPDLAIETLGVAEGAPLIGKTLQESQLRSQYGITALALKRGSTVEPSPSAQERFQAGDFWVLMGSEEKLRDAMRLFSV